MTSTDPQIAELIQRCMSENVTNNVMIYNGERIYIADDRLDDLWITYCNLVDEDPRRKFILYETKDGSIPVTIEGVVRFSKNYRQKQIITDDFQRELVRAYQVAILKHCVISERSRIQQLRAVYCQSEPFHGRTAAAFRIQFPWCRIEPSAHAKIIRPEVIEELKRRKSLDTLREHPDSLWDEILDPETIGNTVPLYGSQRVSNIPHIIYDKCFNPGKAFVEDNIMSGEESDRGGSNLESDAEEIDLSLPWMSKDLPFDPFTHSLVKGQAIVLPGSEDKESRTAAIGDQHWLPLYLSLSFYGKATICGQDSAKRNNSVKIKTEEEGELGVGDEFELAGQLLNMISEERKRKPIFWRKIGMCLYTITAGSSAGLDLWLETCGGERGEAEALYAEYSNNHRSLKTLAIYAKWDNPNEYGKWHKTWSGEALEKAMSSLTDTDIAFAFYRFYWLDFLCFGQSNKKWFVYRNHKWNAITDAIDVSKCISSTFIRGIENYRADLAAKQLKMKKQKERDDIDKAINNIGKFKEKLTKHNYKNTLIKEACIWFHMEGFDETMDKDATFLFPHTNLVVEVDDETKTAIPRPGEPEDYITRNTKGRFENYTLETPIVVELLEWLSQLFPDESLRHEFMKWLASVIRAPNMDKKCTMLTGLSNGGKTSLLKCISLALGSFYVTWEASDFLRAGTPGAANPSIAKARYAKLVGVEEMGKKTVIPGELLKKVTGNSKMNGRMLFENGSEFDAGFKLVIAFNERKPKIEDADEAVMMRLMPFPMASRWFWKLPGTEEECAKKRIFKANRFFEKRLPQLARALAWYMVYYYPIYAEEGLKDHEAVVSMVSEYWREMDDYGQYIDEMVDCIKDTRGVKNPKAVLGLKEAYDEFVTWYTDTTKSTRDIPRLHEFKKEMIQEGHLGPLDDTVKGWRGYSLKSSGGANKKRKTAK